jgi:hypothetical protein
MNSVSFYIWQLFQFFGGLAGIALLLSIFFKQSVIKYLDARISHAFNRDIETLKGQISKQNGLLNSFANNYFVTSQKIIDKRIAATDAIWKAILDGKEVIPSRVSLIYNILSKDETFGDKSFEVINSKSSLKPSKDDLDGLEISSKLVKIIASVESFKPYVTDNIYTLFLCYTGVIGRITYNFGIEYNKGRIYDWENDAILHPMIRRILSETEFSHVKNKNVGKLNSLLEVMEFKILEALRSFLNIQQSDQDAVSHLNRIEVLLAREKRNAPNTGLMQPGP